MREKWSRVWPSKRLSEVLGVSHWKVNLVPMCCFIAGGATAIGIVGRGNQEKLTYLVLMAFFTVILLRIFLGGLRRRLSSQPPVGARYLLVVFLDAKNADALVGDIEERYPRMRKKFGRRRANFWVWSQTIRSLGPIIWAWGKKSAGIAALYEAWIRLRS